MYRDRPIRPEVGAASNYSLSYWQLSQRAIFYVQTVQQMLFFLSTGNCVFPNRNLPDTCTCTRDDFNACSKNKISAISNNRFEFLSLSPSPSLLHADTLSLLLCLRLCLSVSLSLSVCLPLSSFSHSFSLRSGGRRRQQRKSGLRSSARA